MCASAAHSTVADLVGSFVNAAPDQVHTEYLRLVDSLWDSGTLTGLARPAAPVLVAHLDLVSSDRQGYLAVLLGLLVEAGYPATDGEVTTAVHSGLDRYLDLLGRPTTGEPLASALLYLVAHFPDDGDLILAAADRRALDPDDRSRLERNLRRLNLDDVVLGRVWPSPSEWAMTEEEREFDRRWIRTLSPEQIAAAWESDTRMTLGYSGAKAYWALRNGIPTVVTDSGRHRTTKPRGRLGQDMNIDVFRRHAPVFRCPSCHGGLDFRSGAVRCPSCSARYPTTHGVLDLTASISTRAADDPDDVLQNAATMHSIGQYYETVLRPAFLRLMGSNWGGLVTPSDEDGYLARHVHPVDGPVLDLAAGAGRWTAVLSDTLGDDRIVALDLNMTMLTWLHGR
ncbi:MAG TPA: class I SAM-dependent methyltransferase, partial [Mycobacteriales bacterium]